MIRLFFIIFCVPRQFVEDHFYIFIVTTLIRFQELWDNPVYYKMKETQWNSNFVITCNEIKSIVYLDYT